MRNILTIICCGLWVISCGIKADSAEVTWEGVSREITNVKTLLIHPDNPKVIYIGTDKGVFKSEDEGKSWRNILSVRGDSREVNLLIFDSRNKNILYAASSNGLFFSADGGNRWSRTFKGKNSLENECTAVAVPPYAIYLGTKQGLFSSQDNGRSWHKETGKLGNSQIFNLVYNLKKPESILATSLDGLFKTEDKGKNWERIFIAHPVENGEENNTGQEDRDEDERFSNIRYVVSDPNNPDYFYLATSAGIYQSKDRGKSWNILPEYGLLSKDTRFLLFSNQAQLYAVTKSGVFRYENEKWQELSFGLSSEKVTVIALDKNDNLYAAGGKGLFKTNMHYVSINNQGGVLAAYSKDEPKINEVQRAAIKYAEVEPEKIIRWRKQAAKKAFLPQVSLGLDRNTTDLWHWETGSSTKNEDDSLRRGRDAIGWDVRVSWDLSELIWNDDQTNIDVRSRLMVELRDDILDEVTKTYFERIRVKMELDNLGIEERQKRFEKELRLQELTASLDAFTGGDFSRQIKKNAG
ncbi:MAG: hypothetical protein NTW13_01770 [Candidatus Omnitrophica bacterium]|nr:hypothetical protein [Candidatus Omnitrophota bacterium]